jgi:membrane associated rhomboid family serine protease
MLDLTPPPPPSAAEARRLSARFWRSVYIVTMFIGSLWLILGAESNWHLDLRPYALFPGRVESLIGVLTAPLLHGGAEHLLANSFGLLILGVLVLYRYPASAPVAIATVWVLSGLGTWLIGRPSYHIGASGLTHGLMFFVFLSGVLRRDRTSIAAALLTFMFFGGMLLTILPREDAISFEYHLAGAGAGALCAYLLRRRDPAPPRRKYSWEIEEELEALRAQEATDAEIQLPRPDEVPVLWHRPQEERGKILIFPTERRHAGDGSEEDKPTLH